MASAGVPPAARGREDARPCTSTNRFWKAVQRSTSPCTANSLVRVPRRARGCGSRMLQRPEAVSRWRNPWTSTAVSGTSCPFAPTDVATSRASTRAGARLAMGRTLPRSGRERTLGSLVTLVVGVRVALLLEAVAGLANGENVLRGCGIGLEFAAQLGHMGVYGAAQHGGAIPPHLREQLHAAHHGPIASQQRDQQVELLRRQRHWPAAPEHGARGGDDFHGAELLRISGAVSRRSGPP